jgi:multiple sugar transport system substrate-binding protein
VLSVRVGRFEKELNEVSQLFMQQYPNIKVDWRNYSGPIGDTVLALAASGELRDIVNFGVVSTAPLAAQGALLGLNSFIRRDRYDLGDFWPWCVEGIKFKGEMYAMHVDVNTNVVFYNKALLDRAGVAAPTGDWTWNHLLDAARKLTRRADADTVFGFALRATTYYAIEPWLWQHGAAMMNKDMTRSMVDDPRSVEALQWLADLRHVHRVWPTPEEMQQAGAQNTDQLFQSGKLALYYQGWWLRETLLRTPPVFPYDLAEPPKGAVKKASFFHQGPFHIGKATRIPEASWAFLSWWAGKEGQREFQRKLFQGPPARKSLASEFAERITRAGLAALEYSQDSSLHPELGNIKAAFDRGLQPLWRNEQTARVAAAEIAREQNQLLSRR